MTDLVEKLIARVPQWAGATDIKVTPLGGGITNENFRVEVGAEAFVLRVSGANTELLGIDRENECAINTAAAAIGVAPEVVYFIRPEGYLVTRFVQGRPIPPEAMRTAAMIRRVAETLRAVHNMASIPGTFSPFRVVESYAELARGYHVQFPQGFSRFQALAGEIETAFRADPFVPHPCHNDLLNGNFLEDGRIRILDWEYGGMGDVFFDLANFAAHHLFGDEQDHQLLEAYLGQIKPAAFARLKLMKAVSDFREAMWGILQIGISKIDFDFRGYAELYFSRIDERRLDSRWSLWLKEVIHGA